MKKGFLVPVILCASFTCQANDYFFNPVISAKERYYSNIRLLQNPPQDNWISTISPGLNFGLRHENGELKSNFTWNQLFYTNQSELNISEQLFSMGYQHQTGRLQWGTKGYFNNQSFLNTEGTVLGNVRFSQVMAKQLNIAPTVSYALTELSSLSFDYAYNKTTYEKNQNLYLSNYDYHQASGTFTHLYTEHDKLNATLSSSRYKAQVQDRTTFNNIAQLGWQHSFSEQLVTYVSAGINYSQTDVSVSPVGSNRGLPVYRDPVTGFFTDEQPVVKSNGFGGVYQASIQKSFEKGSVSLVGSQNQTPTSQGLQTQTQIAINTAYNINERWTSGLSGSYSIYKMPAQQNSQFNNNRTYASISPNINWKWTPEINVGLSYTYRQQEYKSDPQAREDNSVQLQFTYQPQTNYQVK
ncbi:MAG: hypothetical protein LUP98_04295 [Methylococcaceae bacterium]|nr:hypothetical protein [Methylococcaceae bacterium]